MHLIISTFLVFSTPSTRILGVAFTIFRRLDLET